MFIKTIDEYGNEKIINLKSIDSIQRGFENEFIATFIGYSDVRFKDCTLIKDEDLVEALKGLK